MSDEDTQPQPPAKPSAKTSTVPLKKETVRITLRAKPGTGITQPKKSTGVVPEPKKATAPIPEAKKATAPVPTLEDTVPVKVPPTPTTPGAPAPPTAPAAPKPPAAPTGAKTVPLKPGPAAPSAPGAPTMPLGQPPAPATPAAPSAPGAPTMPLGQQPPPAATPASPGAPTMPLQSPPAAAGAKTIPLAQAPGGQQPGKVTSPMRPGQTTSLPSATVKLGPSTAPMSAPSKALGPDSQLIEEDSGAESGMLVLSIFTMILALAIMLLEMTTSDRVVTHKEGEDKKITVPVHGDPVWDKRIGGKHEYLSDKDAERRFIDNTLPVVPVRPPDPNPGNANPSPGA